jgi:hypothetical protein
LFTFLDKAQERPYYTLIVFLDEYTLMNP